MRFLSQSVVLMQGLAQFKKEHNPASSLVSFLAMNSRHLEALFFEDSSSSSTMAAGLLGPEMSEELQKCNIDVMGMMEKVMMGAGGDMMDSSDMTTMNDPNSLVTPSNPEFLLALAEPDETDCTTAQVQQTKDAFTEFISCTELDTMFAGDESWDEATEQVTEACSALSSPDAVMFMDPDEQEQASVKCMDVVLADNPYGDMMRNIYQFMDKWCHCVGDLNDALPQCLISVIDMLPADQNDVLPVDGEEDVKLPLSLLKKATCMIGLGCSALDDMCRQEQEALDECLPGLNDEYSCLNSVEHCAVPNTQDDYAPFTITTPPELTQGILPDACQRVFSQDDKNSVLERYDSFSEKCIEVEPAAEEEEEETKATKTTAAAESSSSSSGDDAASQDSEVAAAAAAADEATTDKASSYSNVFLGLLVAMAVGVVAFVLYKRRATAAMRPSRKGMEALPPDVEDLQLDENSNGII